MTPIQIKKIMAQLGVDKIGLSRMVGVSARTVDGWLSKHPPSKLAQKILRQLATAKKAA